MYLMRVALPDRPGSLGAVATAIGSVGGDINAVEIVEKGNGVVVDDFIFGLPPNQLPETIVVACHHVEDVRVEWISRYPGGGGLQSDLEALERITADPATAAETLVSLSPAVFHSNWSVLLDLTDNQVTTLVTTTLAPELDTESAAPLAPFDRTHRLELESGWLPGWAESTVVVVPLSQDRAMVIGRLGGPAFLDSEVARLHHLAALAGQVVVDQAG